MILFKILLFSRSAIASSLQEEAKVIPTYPQVGVNQELDESEVEV
ncbi:hypothetical protein [Okeania sp. SIO2B3]|nr:hypothetical protein [Okeania sp. SIO2B3]